MSVHKRKYSSGIVWYYAFDLPGSTREDRHRAKESGFATKQAAIDAEAARRIDEQKKYEMAKAGAGYITAPLPKTLGTLMEEFLRQHAEEKLAPKTVERYREQSGYLAPELLAMPLAEITPLHLTREWDRLLKGGPSPSNKGAAPIERENRPEHRWGGLQRLRACDPVGFGDCESRNQL